MDEKLNDKHLTIKEWNVQDRPREKLLAQGRSALSDAELLAILIGSGNAVESALDLSRRILQGNQNDLHRLGQQDVASLMTYRGIGEAKAITIVAALELGRRRKNADATHLSPLTSSRHIYDYIYPYMVDLLYEEFWIILLNRSLKVIRKEKISQGGVSETVVDLRLIFRPAILHLASAIVLCHNHPSGSCAPSTYDDRLTQQVNQAASVFQIRLIDHLIFAGDSYYSYCDEGKI